jgi:hypothetical protein
MTTENEDFDAEAFVEEGMKDAGIEPEEQETAEQEPSGVMSKKEKSEDEAGEKPVETEQTQETSTDEVKAALEATETEEESEEEVESSIAGILPKAPESEQQEHEKADQRVPLEDHIKLRQRAQEAERERDELKKQQADTSTGGEKPGEEASPLDRFLEENPEEELVPAKVTRDERDYQEAKRQRQFDAARKAEQAALEARRAATQQLQEFDNKAKKATDSEKAVRKAHADYDAVTQAAVKAKLLDDDERESIFNTENPAQAYYDLCKGKLDAIRSGLGMPSAPTSESNQPAGEEQEETEEKEMTDDQIYNEVYGQ